MTRPTLPERAFAAFLFDMDGTILSSIACAAERAWARWARRHGVDVPTFLPTIHGLRAVEAVGRLTPPGVVPVAEAALIHAEERLDVEAAGALRLAPLAG